jgi:UDP-2,3-diacylglucosamine pyrophosphatase LpxH
MQLAFDLISDLHIDACTDSFNWTGLATSPFCIVAGDVARDRITVIETLRHLSSCYQAVFYIDGNDEHRYYYSDLSSSYQELEQQIKKIPKVTYLQSNVIIIDGVAILSTNGWWGFDLDPAINSVQSAKWYQETLEISESAIDSIIKMSDTDVAYLANSIARLQTHSDVKHIVVITHTVPSAELISHDIDLEGSFKFNAMGNSNMLQILQADHAKKIHTWCFGHYHGNIDQIKHGIRFVNNCRGRVGTNWFKHVYHPMRIEINS